MAAKGVIMKTNVGSYDSAARFVVGSLVCMWGLHYETWWGLVGLLPVITGIAGFCPLYTLFHINTTFTDR